MNTLIKRLLVAIAFTLPLSYARYADNLTEIPLDDPTEVPEVEESVARPPDLTSSPTESPAPTVSPSPTAKPTTEAQCTVCAGARSYDYDSTKMYPNWGMRCSALGSATRMGFGCGDIQSRFGAFCGCPGATAGCGVCANGEAVPDPDKVVPLWDTTCDEISMYASLRLPDECTFFLDGYLYDPASYCGCSEVEPPKMCSLCPDGTMLISPDTVPDGADGNTCAELEKFATHVRDKEYCSYMRGFSVDCCSIGLIP